MGFKLGKHGQGYEISSVMIDLAAIPSSLTVSLWTGGALGTNAGVRNSKLFEFTNPAVFQVGLNEFTAPAGLSAYQNVPYWIVLSDFGGSLSIKETTSDAEDAGGEAGATLADSAGGNASVLRLAIEGSRRDSGILAANFAQGAEGDQEIISIGDKVGYAVTLGPAERYLLRGVTFNVDDTTSRDGGFVNPYWLCLETLCPHPTDDGFDQAAYDRVHQFDLVVTRAINGRQVWTAPQGATVAGAKKYVFDWGDVNVDKGDGVDRVGAVLSRYQGVIDADVGKEDDPRAPGVDLPVGAGVSGVDNAITTAVMAVMGEPLIPMVKNLGQTDNGYVALGGSSAKRLSQSFTTGADGFGYRLQGIGFGLSSDSHLPDDSGSVSVSVHADLDGQPGEKLFDLISPTDFAAGFNFFEAPPRTYLDPSTSYALVWTHNAGGGQRLRRTGAEAEDAGARQSATIANVYSLGADLGSLAADASNALEIAVYAEVLETSPGELVVLGPTVALVSNVGQTSESGGYEVDDGIRYAPSFRTGSEAAILQSVELDVAVAPTKTSDISVAIHEDSSGNPGSKVHDLSNPRTIGAGVQKFSAPAGASLNSDTTYYVVITSSTSNAGTDTELKMKITNSNGEDSGSVEGWTIDDRMDFKRSGQSWDDDASVIQIRVLGHFRTVPTRVDPGWALVPEALADEGGYFRLLFMTSDKTAATSTNIDDYNTFAQTSAAAGHDAIQEYSAGFRAVVSTSAIDAVSNTATTGSRVPIYWLDGNQVADNYRDFYDGTWDDERSPTNQFGNVQQPTSVWTGSEADGTKGIHDTHGSTVLGGSGTSWAEYGALNSGTHDPLSASSNAASSLPDATNPSRASHKSNTRSLYALSEVFTVGPNPAVIKRLAITSDPSSEGIYRPGEAIEVTATFGAPVEVQGEPRIQLHLGQSEASQVWADYVSGGALVFPDGSTQIPGQKQQNRPGCRRRRTRQHHHEGSPGIHDRRRGRRLSAGYHRRGVGLLGRCDSRRARDRHAERRRQRQSGRGALHANGPGDLARRRLGHCHPVCGADREPVPHAGGEYDVLHRVGAHRDRLRDDHLDLPRQQFHGRNTASRRLRGLVDHGSSSYLCLRLVE